MKLVVKVFRESQPLVDALASIGVDSKIIRGGLLFTPNYDVGSDSYVIPECVDQENRLFLIDCAERGGGMTNTGDGTVVCSFRGKRLRPYYVPRRGHLSNGTHAHFSIPSVVVTVHGLRRDVNISIMMHKVRVDNGAARIVSEELWSGEFEVLPQRYECYSSAATAVIEKANCYHCREPHYYEPIEK